MTRYSEHYHIDKKTTGVRGVVARCSWRSVLLVMLVIMTGGYVFQTTAVSVKGYDLSDLEHQVSLLKRDTQAVDVQIAEYRSMDSIHKRLPELNLVAATEVSYVSAMGTAVARR